MYNAKFNIYKGDFMSEKNVKNEVNINLIRKNIRVSLYYSSIFFVIGLFFSFFHSIRFFPDFSIDSILGISYIFLIMGVIILVSLLLPVFILIPGSFLFLKNIVEDDKGNKDVNDFLKDALILLTSTMIILIISLFLFLKFLFEYYFLVFLIPLLTWFIFKLIRKEKYKFVFNKLEKNLCVFFLYCFICFYFICCSLFLFDFYLRGENQPEYIQFIYISGIIVLIFCLNSYFIYKFDIEIRYKYYPIYISLFLCFCLLLYMNFFKHSSNLIVERFKLGNISNASVIVDQKTCNEANLIINGYCEHKNESGIISPVTIVSRIGEQYLLEKENRKLVLQKDQVIMWSEIIQLKEFKEPKDSFFDKAIEISNFVKHINMN